MEEVLPEGKNFKLLQDTELPEVLDFLSNFLPDSLKFHQTLRTYLNDRVWDFHFYVNKEWPEQPVILHFPGMTKTAIDNLSEKEDDALGDYNTMCTDIAGPYETHIDLETWPENTQGEKNYRRSHQNVFQTGKKII
ncbi:hypothetical protein WA026_018756 [Henosepilachna vigintioctopunctata]|uniref:Uncharacterized protein n=1 Tax=Henosepilachna vigintioctopunctata TaxID=420089 RepID=A0AAW1TV90_9CUCU